MNIVFENIPNKFNLFKENQKDSQGHYRVTMSPYFNRVIHHLSYSELINPNKPPNSLLGSPPNQLRYGEYNGVQYPINIWDNPDLFKGKYVIPVGLHQDPNFWCGEEGYYSSFAPTVFPRWGHIFENINDKYLRDLRSKRAFLVLDSSLEGYHEPWVWDYFRKGCSKFNIPITQIIFISGNSLVEQDLERWKIENYNKKNVHAIGYSHFEFDVNLHQREYLDAGKKLPTYRDHLNFKSKHLDKIKVFNYLNKKPREHRVWFYTLLKEYNLIDKGVVSMNKPSSGNIKLDDQVLPGKLVSNIMDELPKNALGENNNEKDTLYYIQRLHTIAYLNSFVSVVSEARYQDSEKTVFLSEKTFKPIACQQPFIILGNKHSLKELRKLGYKTFPNFINESYDNYSNLERLYGVLDAIREINSRNNLLEWLSWSKHIVEHNYRVLEYNSFFNPPVKFHYIRELLGEELCTKNKENNLI